MWYEKNNLGAEAIHHALAADLIEHERDISLAGTFTSVTWLAWVKQLPDDLVRTRPALTVGYIWELLFLGEMEAAQERMNDAERLLESPAMFEMSQEEFQSLRGSVSIARAFHAQALGNVDSAVQYARRALTLVPDSDYYKRGQASALIGLTCFRNGDFDAAYQYMADTLASVGMSDNLHAANSITYILAEIRIAQGRLLDAIALYEQALRLAASQGERVLQGTANLYLGLSRLYLERGNLETAKDHLRRSEELGKLIALPDWSYHLRLAQARMQESKGNLDRALELLQEAEPLYHRNPVPDLHPVGALKARVWIRQGKLTEAFTWAQSQKLSVQDELRYLREFEHITLARLLIASYNRDHAESSVHDALALLQHLLYAAEERGGMCSVIEILMLQALAYTVQGNSSAALAPLERALTLAEPQGYVRLFINEGAPLLELLRKLQDSSSDRMRDYVQTLLYASHAGINPEPRTSQPSSPSTVNRLPSLVEPLSQRELEILQLIAQGFSNQEIGERLFLALSTVKGHNRNIFGKLQAQNRTEAVARARTLGLV